MRASDLPSPGLLSNSQTLRHATAHAISRAQINAQLSTSSDTATKLKAFFDACSAVCAGIIAEQSDIDVTNVAFASPTASLVVGGTNTIALTFTPSNATDKTGVYTSSNPAIATVNASSGLITAVGAGTCTITFKSNDEPLRKEAALALTVTATPAP